MIRRLGLAAVLVALGAATFAPADAQAQSRRKQPPPSNDPAQMPIAPVEKVFPLGASWSVVEFNGKEVYDRRATLIVDQNLRGTGFSGCNTFSAAAYPLRQQGFAVGPIAVTKRSCDGNTMAFEKAFLLALRGTQKWEMVNGQVILSGSQGKITLRRSL